MEVRPDQPENPLEGWQDLFGDVVEAVEAEGAVAVEEGVGVDDQVNQSRA